jgi:hypothetical protein
MSELTDMFDEDANHAEGTYAAFQRSESRYGRRHHDHVDRWSRYEGKQDRI